MSEKFPLLEHISFTHDKIGFIWPLPITNTLLATYVIMIFLVVIAIYTNKLIKTWKINKFRILMEILIETLYDFAFKTTKSKEKSIVFLPIFATFFIFILCANWFWLLPLFNAITVWEHHMHLFRAPSADLSTTFALSAFAMITIWTFWFKYNWIWFLWRFFNVHWKNIWERMINLFVWILELVSEFSKFLSFSFRLFWNIFAWKVLLTICWWLTFYIFALPVYWMELFIWLIQAYVFMLLFFVFANMASEKH
jgi:F-type H+-transporting ATPase subunit a